MPKKLKAVSKTRNKKRPTYKPKTSSPKSKPVPKCPKCDCGTILNAPLHVKGARCAQCGELGTLRETPGRNLTVNWAKKPKPIRYSQLVAKSGSL